MQHPIPCLFMRGGTSRGPFFLARDLPADVAERCKVLLAVMGSPDSRQIDGLGGADPLTSKVGIVSLSNEKGVDLDFLFAQVLVNEARVDTTPNCGNMLAAVVPFAIECGLIHCEPAVTTAQVMVKTINTGTLSKITVQLQNGKPKYEGDCRIDGVPGSAAPIAIEFMETEGSVCGSLLPTGAVRNHVAGVDVTCIDNGMPVVLMRAQDLGVTGYESREALNANSELKAKLERIRLEVGPMMGLGDVAKKVVPKMCLVAAPKNGGSLSTRTFIPHDCHASIGVLGAVSVASGAMLEDSVAHELCNPQEVAADGTLTISVEHPSGEFTLRLKRDAKNPQRIAGAELLRTARLIMRGEVMIDQNLMKK